MSNKVMKFRAVHKILIIILFGLASSWPISALAGACAWQDSYIWTSDLVNMTCADYEQSDAPESSCPPNKPKATSLCCCDAKPEEELGPVTIFETPNFQVEIPTVKLSQVSCVTDETGAYTCSIPWLGEYISGIYNYALSIAGILAAIVLMAGGVLWLVSGGDASRITQAKELIVGSVSGLIILMASYVILYQVNPDMVKFNPISLSLVKGRIVKLAEGRYGSEAQSYQQSTCATDTELKNGVEFYATGYYKPAWENTADFFCVVAMQCSCPNGPDKSKNCDHLYGKTYPGYRPCLPFTESTPYCNAMASGGEPQIGDIAGPDCANLPFGTQVCFKGKTYTIKDRGGGIKGKRIDIWSGSSLTQAYRNTGNGILTIGPCP